MKKTFTLFLIAACASFMAQAQYTTAGDGSTVTLTSLSQIPESGVTRVGDHTFEQAVTVTIAAGDHFQLEDSVTLRMAQDVQLIIEGTANFEVAHYATLTKRDAKAPSNVFHATDAAVTPFKNVTFEYTGIKVYASAGITVDGCTFRRHDGSTAHGSGAISLGGSASVSVTGSTFEYCQLSAIAGAANNANPLTIENCLFYKNGQAGRNYPQVNVTAASSVVIRNNVVVGDRNKRNVGGIIVSNLMGAARDAVTLIEGNTVRDARYGIALYSAQRATVLNNTLIDNNVETNPNNGGSGINVYDPAGAQETMITGNYIKGSLWGITVVGGKTVNAGKLDDPEAADYNPGRNIFVDNGNNGTPYDLYNNSANTVYAQGNLWSVSVQVPELIATVITDKADNSSLGEVLYWHGVLPLEGDVDHNGVVNGSDVTALYNILLLE